MPRSPAAAGGARLPVALTPAPSRPHTAAALLAAALLWSGGALAAPLTNADFSSGFDGWLGQVVTCTDAACTDETLTALPDDASFASLPGNFSTVAGGAVLTTSFLNDGIYEVRLFQDFVVDSLTGRFTNLLLDFSLGLSLTGPDDLAVASLGDPAGLLPTIDLLGGGPVDVTAYAGRAARLFFAVTDFDDEADSLTIGGLGLTPVPVPAPALLLLGGLALLARRRRLRLPADR